MFWATELSSEKNSGSQAFTCDPSDTRLVSSNFRRASRYSLGVCVQLVGEFRLHGYGYSGAEQQKKNGLGIMLTTVVRIADQVLAGLERIRSSKIAHRDIDIKPENLLSALDASTIKFINFGIFKPFPVVSSGSLQDRRA
ncbi:hypothetical protein F5146DRAFT_1003513 [Armillaria mellea]|nr:hypothetical protein F5146DRAFT_1003513 [Armillaria mellea]